MSGSLSEKDMSLHVEHEVVPDELLHQEALLQSVTAAKLAEDVLLVDETKAAELRRELASNAQGGYAPITPEERRANLALNRKLDTFVIPFCAIIFLFNGLDRSNLGNAQTDNFSTDIGLPASAINTASSLFFATYVPFQPLMAAIGKRFGQTYFIAFISALWGIITICNAFVKSNGQLIAVRLLMGVAESGFYPSVLSYLSIFYPRYDLAFRYAMFYGSYSIAGAFGGLIAYGTFQIHGALHSWQYLFIIEGSVPILIALICPFWLPKDPKTAWFLNAEERQYGDKRMILDAAANLDSTYKITKRDIIEAFKDWRMWLTLWPNMLISTAAQSFTIFFPIVVKGLGYSGAIANLMTVPPYVVGTIFLVAFAWVSDRYKTRTYPILAGTLLIIIGLIIAVAVPLANTGGRYAGLLILLSGTFIPSPLASAWLAGNSPEPGKRTLMVAINGWSNLAGIIGSELFQSKYGPNYIYPLQVELGLMVAGFFGYLICSIVMRFVNRAKARKVAAATVDELEEENRSDVRAGDKKWTFVYGL